jgi:hypothetical protein
MRSNIKSSNLIIMKKIILPLYLFYFTFFIGLSVSSAITFCNCPCCQDYYWLHSYHNSSEKPVDCHKKTDCQNCYKEKSSGNNFIYDSSSSFSKPFYSYTRWNIDQNYQSDFWTPFLSFIYLHLSPLPLFLQNSTFLL